MTIVSKYNFGDILYLKMDDQQRPRLLTAVNIRPQGVLYELSGGPGASWHNDFEITIEANILAKTT
jgi:hypothetical protein